MTRHQLGVFEQQGPYHHYLEFKLIAGIDRDALRQALQKMQSEFKADGQAMILAFGHEAWAMLSPAAGPDGLRDFDEINGAVGFVAPSTQGDIWVWIQGPSPDRNLDVAMRMTNLLSGFATVALEVQGYAYHGNRDLIGFVDGTANGKTFEDQTKAALIPGSEGGSYLLTQKWVHDLRAFNAIDVQKQEAVVGRTKQDDIELEGDAMPADSHVSRTDASEDGVGLKLWRRSSPYGGVNENGLYFVAFACDIRRFDVQLQRMYGTSGDGVHDQLLNYSTAVSGSYWYVPGSAELSAVLG